MNTEFPSGRAAAARSRVTLLVVFCGLLGAACASAADSATPEGGAPHIAIKFDPQNLATEAGAKAVYRQLVQAAERVCPEPFTGSRLVSNVTLQCRQHAIAGAVRQINDPRLAAISASRVKTG